jgi:hypothetical protein
MKAEAITKREEFKPVTISITMETEEEVHHLHDIFNSTQVLESADVDGQPVREAIVKALGKKGFLNTKTWSMFVDNLHNKFLGNRV